MLRSTFSYAILVQKDPCLSLLSPLCTGLEERRATQGKKTPSTPENRPMLHPHAAGIDGGAEEPWGGVPADRDAHPVQQWSALTCDLPRLADC